MTSSKAATLLQDFVNTRDGEEVVDTIGTPAELTAWLAAQGLLAPGSPPAGEHDLGTAVALREGLRAAFLGHHGPERHGVPEDLEEALARLPLRVSLTRDPALVPAGDGVLAGLAGVAAAIMHSVADGTWPRLKVCQADTCRWAFLDTSKNRSRAWCSMQVCGNRTKTRNYRARSRSRQ